MHELQPPRIGAALAGALSLAQVQEARDLNRSNCIELVTTQTLDSAMAKPAMGGLRWLWPARDRGDVVSEPDEVATDRTKRAPRQLDRVGMTSRGR